MGKEADSAVGTRGDTEMTPEQEAIAWAHIMLEWIDSLAKNQGINWAYREDVRAVLDQILKTGE